MERIHYNVERFADVADELLPLYTAHYQEIASDQDIIKLNPDIERYCRLNDDGFIHVITVRNENSILIGYFITVISVSLHYAPHKLALNDVLYVDPQYRGHGVFSELLSYAETTLKKLGVSKLYIHCKTYHDFTPLLQRHGYRFVEKTCEKLLIGEN